MRTSKKGESGLVSKRGALIESRLVPDPAVSDAEFYHQRYLHPNKPNIGKVWAHVNMKELIGGYWRYKGRSNAQTMAAARFKQIYEEIQIGGARSVDYEAPMVDGGVASPEVVMERGMKARQAYREAVQHLGLRWSNLIEQVVIYDVSQRRLARAYGFGDGRSGRRNVAKNVDDAMSALAAHFNL
jgi:hypothetical protein